MLMPKKNQGKGFPCSWQGAQVRIFQLDSLGFWPDRNLYKHSLAMLGPGHITPHIPGDPKVTEAPHLLLRCSVQHKSRGSLLLLTMPHLAREKLFVLCPEFCFCCSIKDKVTAPWQLHSSSQGQFLMPSTCSCFYLCICVHQEHSNMGFSKVTDPPFTEHNTQENPTKKQTPKQNCMTEKNMSVDSREA